MNWNSSLVAIAVRNVRKCRNGQVKTIWLPFSGSHKKKNFSERNKCFSRKWEVVGES